MDCFDLRIWRGSGNEPELIDQVTIDSREVDSSHSLFVALPGKITDGHEYVAKAIKRGAKYAIVREGFIPDSDIPQSKLIFVPDPKRALQEIAGLYRKRLPTKIIAITGSYGKTMVKDLLLDLLRSSFQASGSPESYNSQIGIPLSLFSLSKTCEIAVIEAAISEKGEMDRIVEMLKPDFAIMTPVGDKHIDRLGSIQTLISELCKLFNGIQWGLISREILDLPAPSSQLHFWDEFEPGLPFAERTSLQDDLSIPYQIRFPDLTPYHGVIISGYYYYLNLLNMAIKAAFKLGVPSKEICEKLKGYILEPIRKEIWKSPVGVTFINDTYAETPLSIDHALKFLKNHSGSGHKIFVFEGLKGERKEEDYRRVGSILSKYPLDYLLLIGNRDYTPLVREVNSVKIVKFDSYKEAFEFLKMSLHPNDTVLVKGSKKEPITTLINSFHESPPSNLCQVNLAAIEHNIKILKKKLQQSTRMMVMVKAAAYGTDTFRIAKFLKSCGIDILGVSYVEEGVSLRQMGVTDTIFVLNAVDYEIEHVVKWGLEIGVSTSAFIERLAKVAEEKGKIIKVHLHVDTGMGRFGCQRDEALDLSLQISRFSSLKLEGIFTHFASADDPEEDAFTHLQAERLLQVIGDLQKKGINPPWKHAANSASVLRFSFPEFNMVRVGLAVYGLQPSLEQRKNDLRLAISLISRIAGISQCKKGETISYGRSYLVKEKEKQIAVLPIGYFDGLHRNYSNKGSVLIRGKRAPMVGKICMDFMMVDVTDIPDVKVGDPVLIFGEDEHGHYLSPEELALKGNSISHELITCLGPRIQRFFIYEETSKRKNYG